MKWSKNKQRKSKIKKNNRRLRLWSWDLWIRIQLQFMMRYCIWRAEKRNKFRKKNLSLNKNRKRKSNKKFSNPIYNVVKFFQWTNKNRVETSTKDKKLKGKPQEKENKFWYQKEYLIMGHLNKGKNTEEDTWSIKIWILFNVNFWETNLQVYDGLS